MNTTNYLDEEIARLYDKMSKLDPVSEEYGKLATRWTELMEQKRENAKHEESVVQNEKQIKENRKDRASRFLGDMVKTFVPLGTSVLMTFLVIAAEAKGATPFGIGKKWIDKITKY